MDYQIRFATAGDLDSLFQVHQRSVRTLCAASYSAEQMACWFEGRTPDMYLPIIQQGKILLAESAEGICAFAGVMIGEVVSLFVLPSHVNQGLGGLLLDLALPYAHEFPEREVSAIATQNAVHFYEGHGFICVEEGWFERGSSRLRYPVVKMVLKPTKPCGAIQH